MTTSHPRRGEIWVADLEPTRGEEIRKSRPVVIVSEAGIGRLRLRIVVPITEWNERFAAYSWMVRLDPSPVAQPMGVLPDAEVEAIADAVALCVGSRKG